MNDSGNIGKQGFSRVISVQCGFHDWVYIHEQTRVRMERLDAHYLYFCKFERVFHDEICGAIEKAGQAR